MSDFIFNDDDAQTYAELSLNIKQQLHAISRKYQSRINKYAEILQKIVNKADENVRSNIDKDIVCNDYIVNADELSSAISTGVEQLTVTVADGSARDMYVQEICNDLRTTLDESQIAVSAIEALEYCQDENYSDVITIYNDKISSLVRNEESRYSTLANTMRQVILDRSSDVQQKLDSVLSVLTVNNNQDLPGQVDLSSLVSSMSEYSFSTPAAALFGTIDIDWSNAWTAVSTIYQKSVALRLQVLIAFSKVIYAGYSKIKNWVQRNMTVGQWITVNDNYDDLSFDQGGLTSKYVITGDTYARIKSKFDEKGGCVLKLYVPGGVLFFTGVEEETTWPYGHFLRMYFRPYISTITLPEKSNANLGTLCHYLNGTLYDITLAEVLQVKNLTNGPCANRSATVPYDCNDLQLQGNIPYAGLMNAITLFMFFIDALGYGYENEVGFSTVKPSDLGYTNGGLVTRLSQFIPGYTDNKWDTADIWMLSGSTTIYASLISGNFVCQGTFSLGFLSLIEAVFNRSTEEEYSLSYEWVNTLGTPAYHLATNSELAATFERALGTVAIIAAVVTLSIVAFKFTRSIKKKASIAQAKADRFYFSDNFTGTDADWNSWYGMQKKANLLNILAGAATTAVTPSAQVMGKIVNSTKDYVVGSVVDDISPRFTGLATSQNVSDATADLATEQDLDVLATKNDLTQAKEAIESLIR